MTPHLTPMSIALKNLSLHDVNARAGSPEIYEGDDIASLAASIATHGLLNPLIVQKTGKTWSVLAGGRRLAVMRLIHQHWKLADRHSLARSSAAPGSSTCDRRRACCSPSTP